MEYYWTIKRNELLIYNMDESKNMLSKKSQTQKTTNCIITFIWDFQKRRIYRKIKQSSGCQGLKTENWHKWSFWGDGNVLNCIMFLAAQLYELSKNHGTVHLQWIILWCVNNTSIKLFKKILYLQAALDMLNMQKKLTTHSYDSK